MVRKNVLFLFATLACLSFSFVSCGDGEVEPNEVIDDDIVVEGPRCGNGTCEPGETAINCLSDCKVKTQCGNGVCEEGETAQNCALDCGPKSICGDGQCDLGETVTSCPKDCSVKIVCGNGLCEEGESSENCEDDCGAPVVDIIECGDGVCEGDETESNCAADCKVDTVLPPVDEAAFSALAERKYRILHDYEVTKSLSDKSGNLSDFFASPYPSILRTKDGGRPDLTGIKFPGAANSLALVQDLRAIVESEYAGFTPIGGIYFRSTHVINEAVLPKTPDATMDKDACFQIVNVEKGSKYFGHRIPLYVTFHPESTVLWAPNTLVLRPVPGLGPNPGDKHVAIVQDCIKTGTRGFDRSRKLEYVLAKAAPDSVSTALNPYVDALSELGYDLSKIRAMTGYPVSNVAKDLDAIAEDLKTKGGVETDVNGVALGSYTSNAQAHVFRGRFRTLNYVNAKDGRIHFEKDGHLSKPGEPESVVFEISIPKKEVPANGFPLAIYGHGTGGDASSHDFEARTIISAGVDMAMLGFDAHLHGERGGSDLISLILKAFTAPIVIRESWRQTVIDMMVLYDLMEHGKLILPPSPSSKGKNITFDDSYGLYMGHSQGSQEAGILLGVTPQIKNAFLSAVGSGILTTFCELRISAKLMGITIDQMLVSDVVGTLLLNVAKGDLSYDSFITTQFVQPLMDPIDPLNYATRFIKDPPYWMKAKNIVQTMGLGDQNTAENAQMITAAAIGLPVVGRLYLTNDALRLSGMDQAQASPASNNIPSGKKTVTGGLLQFIEKTDKNPHFVIYYVEAAKRTYPAFFKSVLAGKPEVAVSGQLDP